MKINLSKTISDTNREKKAQASTAVRFGSRGIEQEEAEAAEDCPQGRTGSYHYWLSMLACCFLLPLAVLSCAKHGPTAKPADVEYYTCTMHPSVRSQDPKAKCPICGMSLVPVKKRASLEATNVQSVGASERQSVEEAHDQHSPPDRAHSEENAPHDFTVPVARQQQIGVTYGAIERRPFTHTIRSAGIVAADAQRRRDYVARVEGYVEKLFVFSRGELVEKNAP